MNHSASPQPRTIRRHLLATMGAGIIGAGLFLTPAVALADTGQTIAQTTDPSGDARANLRNVPNADLLAAGDRIGSSTVTVFVDLTTAPTQAQLADAASRGLPYGGRYDYTSNLAVNGGIGLSVVFHNTDVSLFPPVGDSEGGTPDPTPACVAYFGPTSGPTLHSPVVVNTATNELSATFSRADVNAAQACFGPATLTAGNQVTVTGATSDIQTPYKNAISGGVIVKDSAGSGPSATLVN